MQLQVPREVARRFPPMLTMRLLARAGIISFSLEG